MQCTYSELLIFVITVVLEGLKTADLVVVWLSESCVEFFGFFACDSPSVSISPFDPLHFSATKCY